MSDRRVVRAADVEYEPGQTSDGLRKGLLIGEAQGANHLELRRCVLEPGGSVPPHTNGVDHEQYVIEGQYTVGVGDAEYTLAAGDAVHIPAGSVHWYENDGDGETVFLAAVPAGDDTAEVVEE